MFSGFTYPSVNTITGGRRARGCTRVVGILINIDRLWWCETISLAMAMECCEAVKQHKAAIVGV
jgi:hypothetical protein